MSSGQPPTILVVDDDADIRVTLGELLEAEGYVVATAAHGEEALTMLRAADQPPALILLDLMMPVMNGWQFLQVRQDDETLRRVPVAVISASSNYKASIAGFSVEESLAKPLDFERLLTTVERYCEARKSG